MKDLDRISRGEVFYITSRSDTVGSEQKSGRPAVVVSNNMCNEFSPCVEICYFTLQEKNKLPTHVLVDRGPCINSIILCEQVTTISKERIGDYMCTLPDDIMDAVDKALIVSLDLDYIIEKERKTPVTTSNPIQEDILDSAKRELDKFREENRHLSEENIVLKSHIDGFEKLTEDLAMWRREAETYEKMYNNLLDRIMRK